MEELQKREREIYRITIFGAVINLLLVIAKCIFGVVGRSSAMIADAAHSMSDLITDAIVVIFVRIGVKPEDEDHNYGHGKYETIAASVMGILLLFVGVMIFYSGVEKCILILQGGAVDPPTIPALIVALLSIALKEFTYRITIRTGRRVSSQVVIANAWHNRSDALASIGTALGIGGAILLGSKWVILDPLAAIVLSFFIIRTAWQLIKQTYGELLEKSLPDDMKREITKIAESCEGVSQIHHLRTRRIGNNIAIEMHIRMPGDTPLVIAHDRTKEIENSLRHTYGEETHIIIHVEPLKDES